jgi:hypothetical protein
LCCHRGGPYGLFFFINGTKAQTSLKNCYYSHIHNYSLFGKRSSIHLYSDMILYDIIHATIVLLWSLQEIDGTFRSSFTMILKTWDTLVQTLSKNRGHGIGSKHFIELIFYETTCLDFKKKMLSINFACVNHVVLKYTCHQTHVSISGKNIFSIHLWIILYASNTYGHPFYTSREAMQLSSLTALITSNI